MKYFRSQNLNPGNILDNTVSVLSNGDVEINPTNKVTINGDLLVVNGNVPGPEVTNVIYVTLDGNDDNTGLGEGPDQAKRTLKAACAMAQEGTTIFMRSGEFYEDNPVRVPPKVSIIGDNLRRVIIRPLNGPLSFNISNIVRTNGYVTITTTAAHGLNARDRVRVRCSNNSIDQVDVNLTAVTSNTMTYRQPGANIIPSAASGKVLHGRDMMYVNSQSYIAGVVFKGLQAPAYCINIDSDAIVDTSPYVQNCSNINGPWMRNGTEWRPFITEQPDLNGTMVTGPRPLLDNEIAVGQDTIYGIDLEGAGGGMLIDGDRYSSETPIKSMVADAFTQVSQGGIGFHITNFGYMQLVSCFAVFCSKAFYATRGGYLSISNSVIDFGTEGFVADGYYLDPYAEGRVINSYYSSVGSISVVTEGAGYNGTSPIVVTIDPPAAPGGVQATASANYDPITGKVNAVSIDEPGTGYAEEPTIIISGGGATIDATVIANLNRNSTISVSYLPSKPQVGSIMFVGTNPVAHYISNTVGSIAPFTYNETKCRRDTGYIIDGVYYDAALGTNYNAVINGRSYRRATASEVIDSQLTQTVGAINYLKTLLAAELSTNATAISRSNSAITEIVDIIENGIPAVNALTFPDPTGANTNLISAKEQLIDNRAFIMAEITAWIADQVAGPIAPFTGAFTYDAVTCARDVGYIVDALCYDIIYGGNSATKIAAQAYFENSVSVLPAGQILPTAAAFARLQSIAQDIVQEIAVTTSSTNIEIQDVSGTPATATEGTEVFDLVQIIIDVIVAGNTSGMPSTSNPSISWADAGIQTAVTNLAANKSAVIDDTIFYIDQEYASLFTYDQQKCKRDVGIILNAVLADMTFASNYQSTAAGVAYLRSYSSKVTSLQKSQTIAGLEEARDQTLALTVNPTAITDITTNFNIVIDIINNGLASIPTLALPAPTLVRGGFAEASAILDANRTFIQDEITAWIAVNYPVLAATYNSAKCRRDISYIIDAMRYDMTYEGNTQTTNAALAYVEGSVIFGQVEETQDAYEYLKTIVGAVITNNTISRSLGNTTTQNVLLPVGSPAPAPNSPSNIAEQLLQIIIDEIDHGPGYIPDPLSYPAYTKGDSTLNSVRLSILTSLTDIQDAVISFLNVTYGGSITVSVFPAITTIAAGTEVSFHNVSTISTGGTALEYVGAGVTYNALPFFGGEPIAAKERIEINNGKCFTVTNDQVGNYRVGEYFTVNALTGAVTIDADNLNLSGLAAIGPFKRNGIPVGIQLREVSDNNNLIASTGTQDGNTTPTQRAVATYVQNRYLNKVQLTPQTISGDIQFSSDVNIDQDLNVDGGDITTTSGSINLLNTNASVINFAGAATDLQIGSTTGITTVNNNLTVDGNLISGSATAVNEIKGLTSFIGTGAEEFTVKIKGSTTGAYLAVGTKSDPAYGIVNQILKYDASGYLKYSVTASEIKFNIANGSAAAVQNDALKITDTGYVYVGSTIPATNSTSGALQVAGGVGIAGNLYVGSNETITGDLEVRGGDITTNAATFNLLNATATTINAFGAATTLEFGAATGTTNINNNLDVDGDVNIDGGDLTVSTSTFNLANTTATVINFAGAATSISIGAATGTTTINNANTVASGDLAVNGGDITTTETTFNLLNATATTVNFAGAATALNMGATTGTTTVRNNFEVDLNATINGNLDVDGDVNIDGGDLTASTTTFNLLNTTVETGNVLGAATTINVGTTAVTAGTLKVGPLVTGNTLKLQSTTIGTVNYTTDVTSGTVNAWQSLTGTINIGSSGTVNLGTSISATTTAVVGGALTGNTLKIASTAGGTANLSSDVTTGIVNVFTGVTTGTVNVATGGTNTINVGSSTSTVNIGNLVLTTDLAVQYGGTGRSTFTANGVIYGNTADGLLVTAASVPGSNATTSYGILTTNGSNVPVWTDTIDGGSY